MLQLVQAREAFHIVSVISQSLISFPFLLFLAYLDFQLIRWLNAKAYFNTRFNHRLFAELGLGIILSISLVFVANLAFSGRIVLENFITKYLLNIPAVAAIFINSLMIFLLEFFVQYDAQKNKELEISELRTENSEYLYNQLRSQINPHFLFNSLNVLSALIHKDQQDAVTFTKKLSGIYRYVLNHDRVETIRVAEELHFAENYIEILKVRFGNHLSFSSQLENDLLNGLIPPMSFQLLIENTVKHNIVSEDKKLNICLYEKDGMICFENNKNPMKTPHHETSEGLGLKNLNSRFLLTGNHPVVIKDLPESFIVKLPLV
jgi:sensor histidine kinase YesM